MKNILEFTIIFWLACVYSASGIIMTTGDLKEDYEIIQVVYVYTESNSRYAIDYILRDLKREAEDVGADAVVGVRMQLATFQEEDGLGEIRILIYGTAVKLK